MRTAIAVLVRNSSSVAGLLVLALAAGRSPAQAIFTENFQTATASGGSVTDFTERQNGTYGITASIPGWSNTATTTASQILTHTSTDAGSSGNIAIMINEGGSGSNGITRTLSNLFTVGQQYTLRFEHWGDNRAGAVYSFNYSINGFTSANIQRTNTSTTNAADGQFAVETYTFTATSASSSLTFTEVPVSGSQGSPVFDNITITPVPEPIGAVGLAVAGLGLPAVGRLRRRVGF